MAPSFVVRKKIEKTTEEIMKKSKKLQFALLLALSISFGAGKMQVKATQTEQIEVPSAMAVQSLIDPEIAAAAAAITDDTVLEQELEEQIEAASDKKLTGVYLDIENSLRSDAKGAILNGYLSLLNKDYILRDELEIDLVSIGGGHQLERRAASFITQMVKDAKTEKLYINVTSSYRTYAKQVNLFKNKISRVQATGKTHEKAVEEAGTVVAVPGTSEHQLGLSLDFVTNRYKKLDEGMRNTNEYKWIEENGWKYGYVIRYPKGKSDITGIISEPWHLRYVGIPAAKLISEQGVCLEEFLGVAYDGQKNGISHGAGWVNTGR